LTRRGAWDAFRASLGTPISQGISIFQGKLAENRNPWEIVVPKLALKGGEEITLSLVGLLAMNWGFS
jgi:hypothetical protein